MSQLDGLIVRTTCRSCNSEELLDILSLGTQYISNFVDGPDATDSSKAPLELVLCDGASGGCGLLQLRHTVPGDLLYRQYWYRSGVNATMTRALGEICNRAESIVRLSPGDVVLDIGCNDGTLLRAYGTDNLRLIGFEPANNLVELAEAGTTRIVNDFFTFDAFREAVPKSKAKVVTSIAMFYDLEEPNAFVADVAKCLDEDGLWVIQMSYLPSMLEQNAFDNICHEHLQYYSLMSVQTLLNKQGLEIADVELNDVNGGSFRLYVRHTGGRVSPAGGAGRVESMEDAERALGLGHRAIYDGFAARVKAIGERLVDFIAGEAKNGKTVYVYGASTKGNTLLQYFGLDHTMVRAAAERNADKWGKKTVGTMIPIISESEARSARPDYFLVLPWHFLNEFREREREFLNRGGKFIVPLPEFRIIGGAGS